MVRPLSPSSPCGAPCGYDRHSSARRMGERGSGYGTPCAPCFPPSLFTCSLGVLGQQREGVVPNRGAPHLSSDTVQWRV